MSGDGAPPPPPRHFSGRPAAAVAPASAAAGELAMRPGPRTVAAPRASSGVPAELLADADLRAAMAVLPAHYNFEVHKTVWRVRQAKAAVVALQMPEGFLMFACALADILAAFGGAEHVIVLGDVTYGACCVDDLGARALGADLLIHYGHSCLVPLAETVVPVMYVFVDIGFDRAHLAATIRSALPPPAALAIAGTIQFAGAVQATRADLASEYPGLVVPQSKPLSPGEVLGCTAPPLGGSVQALVFVSDGRFHLEAIMIANPGVPAYRYDPYTRRLTRESYDHAGMRACRRAAVVAARQEKRWGVVLGTLGRQGNPSILRRLESILAAAGIEVVVFLMSELSPARLAIAAAAADSAGGIGAWVQVCCPRLSIDWGEGFGTPLLTPYEAEVALGLQPPWWGGGLESVTESLTQSLTAPYPMDYYARGSGPWTNYGHAGRAVDASG